MIRANMDVTVEAGAFENDSHKGENARVVRVIGWFAIIEIAGVDGLRATTIDYVQPRMTANNLTIAQKEKIA